MIKEKDTEFVNEYKKYYQIYFDCIADSIDNLASIHKKYPEQYDKIIQFTENPEIIDEIIEKVPSNLQLVLLRVLLKAGEFGRKFARLMEMEPKEKNEFAEDLRKFAKELQKM